MLAYRKTDFDLFLQSHAPGTNSASPFYSPNFFARMGLFLFGNLGASSAFGLFALIFLSSGDRNLGFLLIFSGVALGFSLEAMLRRHRPFFRAGLEEAALYGALGCLVAGLIWSFELYKDIPVGFLVLVTMAFALAAIRYADGLLAVAAYALGLYVVFSWAAGWGDRARYVLPPLVIAISSAMIWASGKALRHSAWRYWHHLGKALRCVAILTCYAGGNNLAVRELSQSLFDLSLATNEDIPLALVFYGYSFGFPIFCIAWGLRQHDRLFLHMGLVLAGFAVFTYKYYHHGIPLEIGMVIGGVILLGVAIAALKWFRHPRFGISSQSQESFQPEGAQNLEGLAALANISGHGTTHQNPGGDEPIAEGFPDKGLQGEGGKFGGGGASSGF